MRGVGRNRVARLTAVLAVFAAARVVPGLSATGTVVLTIAASPAGFVRSFTPNEALGATLDGQSRGDVDRIYTPATVRAMRSAGFGPVSYRLRTELACEAWHWNPVGRWSDGRRRRGYWTSSSALGAPIRVSHGYRLPRRGNTIDQADDDGYSRIDDGDPATFWKSNPYLDNHVTGEPDALHPQHVVFDLGAQTGVDAIRVEWGVPFATRYVVQYWIGDDAVDDPAEGKWVAFPTGSVVDGAGGDSLVRLAAAPVAARYVRVVMTTSSGRAAAGSRDARDGYGYAIREAGVGTLTPSGAFADAVQHAADRHAQTVVYVSSTDPWHRAEDEDRDLEQPGLDLFFRCGITQGLPAVVPVAILTGNTPDDAAAEMRYLEARGYPVGRVEMGEEPDGQYVQPEDYAALYLRWASAIHGVDPSAALGGPAFQSTQDTTLAWPDATGDTRWLGRFLRYVRERNRLADFAFFSFEWYPFDDLCEPVQGQLAAAPGIFDTVLANWGKEGLPAGIPVLATEYGYSSFAGQVEVDLPGAIENADFVGRFLTAGGTAAFCYGLEPGALATEPDCETYGGLTMFLHRPGTRRLVPTAACRAARLVTCEWVEPGTGEHELYRASIEAPNGDALVRAYPLRRPDGLWSILVVNVDLSRRVRIVFRFSAAGAPSTFDGNVDVTQLSEATYRWHAAGERGYASPNLAPRRIKIAGDTEIELPPASVTVVRGRVLTRPSSTSPSD